MSRSQLRPALAGGAVAVAAAAAAVSAPSLNLDGVVVLGGVLFGGVLVMADERPSLSRLVAFAAGIGAAVVGDEARGRLLPETTTGAAVAAVIVVLLSVGVSAGTLGRLRLWAVLLGAGAFAAVAGSVSSDLAGASAGTASTTLSLLVTSAAGFAAASLLSGAVTGPAGSAISAQESSGTSTRTATPGTTSIPLEEIAR